MRPAKPTLASLITRYRRSGADGSLKAGTAVELEVRFRGVDFPIFQTVLEGLNSGALPVEEGAVIRTVDSVMPEKGPARRRGAGASLVRRIFFGPGGGRTGEKYYRKWPLAPRHRVRRASALDYDVVVSAEEPLPGPFASDTSAQIRVKSRVQFRTKAGFSPSPWLIDLTVVRAVEGSALGALGGIVAKMFRGPPTARGLLAALDLASPRSEMRDVYRFEIEIEHRPPPPGAPPGPVLVPSDLAGAVDRLLGLAKPEYTREALYQAEVFRLAQYVVQEPRLLRRYERDWGLKRLAPPVTGLTRSEYKAIYPPVGYFLLDKADGVRALAHARDGRLVVLGAELHEFRAGGGDPRAANATVVDGELVRLEGRPVFFCFDVVAIGGETVAGDGYEKRVRHLEEAAEVLRLFGLDARPKPVVELTAAEPGPLRAQFQDPAFRDPPYATDGRILVRPGAPYARTAAFKWKPRREATIDFLARRAPAALLGRPPYARRPGHALHFLFVGIRPEMFRALGLQLVPGYAELFGERGGGYFPVQFAPSDAPLAYLYYHPDGAEEVDGRIVELRCGGGCPAAGAQGVPAWELARIRRDRERALKGKAYFGNDFRTAELNWLNYVDPFPEDQLWDGPEKQRDYFSATKPAIYRAQTAFTSFVKTNRIRALGGSAWVVDLAVGKGQDYGRYLDAGVKNLVGVDQDQGALSELVRRKYSHASGRGRGRGRGRARGRGTSLYVIRADLAQAFAATVGAVRKIRAFPPGGGDAVVCNLAVHYFAGTAESLHNFAALCRALVKVGGTVALTTMFGGRIHRLLSAEKVGVGEAWTSREDTVVKYSIRRDYADEALTPVGQRVGVVLPFSRGEYYDEYLVNVDHLCAVFAEQGFRLEARPSFEEYFADFATRNPAVHKKLSAEDLAYLALYGEIVLRREK